MDIVVKISLTLNKNGFEWLETEWECSEKSNMFQLTRKDADGGVIRRNLPIENLFKVDKWFTSYDVVEYNIITPKEKIREAKNLLMSTVVKTVTDMKKTIDDLFSHIKDV